MQGAVLGFRKWLLKPEKLKLAESAMRRGGGNCCRHGAGRDSQLAGVVVMKPRALTMTVEALDARFQTLLGDLTRMPQPSRPNVRAHSMYPIYQGSAPQS